MERKNKENEDVCCSDLEGNKFCGLMGRWVDAAAVQCLFLFLNIQYIYFIERKFF